MNTSASPGPSPDAALVARHQSVIEYLWGVAGLFSADDGKQAGERPTVPEQLAIDLNGGATQHIGRYYSEILLSEGSLPANARLLDMGCGYGRIALELLPHLGQDQVYVGLDPNAEAIAWASDHISPLFPNATFELVDIHSKPYNPGGGLPGAWFRFPFEDGSLDLVFLFSVMTHVDLATAVHYINEAARTLNPTTGRLVATFFLLDPAVEEMLDAGSANPPMPWRTGLSRTANAQNPELAIAHPRQVIEDALRDAGFGHVGVRDGNWCGRTNVAPMDYQDLITAHRSASPPSVRFQERYGLDGQDLVEAIEVLEDLTRLGFVGQQAVAAVAEWAMPVVVNLLRWDRDGWRLAVGDSEPVLLEVDLRRLRALGLDRALTQPCGVVPDFLPVPEHELAVLLAASRKEVLGGVLECCRNGITLLRHLQRGGAIVLVDERDERLTPAPLPTGPTAP